MTDVEARRWRLGAFESPLAFARACIRLAVALVIVGIAGLVDRLFVLPLAAVLVVFAALAWLAESDRLDDPDDPLIDALDPLAVDLQEAPPAATEEPVEVVERTFRLPTSVGAERVWLVGDFNDWSHTAHPMRREAGWFVLVLVLEPGRTYRYRYLLDGVRWENDWDADRYVPNAFGTEDSVVCT